ncbi:hypothetical protein PVMG_03656 [Plasmodium vivax Mauritania I]|uniref:Uncharacterized protein n=1 Tax=Plasmodium vivax Mauritania I TaxID=1035515 RepID=A0A0J9TBB6_PLAVI|nr:hypothetical protein PVMG_03656 [Plasmodium vivax Mauritania I]
MAKNMCKIFISIYKKLKGEIENYKADSNYKKDFAFLNYWVNWKIQENGFNEYEAAQNFNDYLEVYELLETNFDTTNLLIYDINKDELYKMNILYNLYEKYTKLNSIISNVSNQDKQELLTLSTQCCTDYNEANYICNSGNNNNSEFCKKLKKFQTKYEELNNKVEKEKSEYSDYFKSLSKCPNNKIITTSVTGSIIGLIPLLGVLYKVK